MAELRASMPATMTDFVTGVVRVAFLVRLLALLLVLLMPVSDIAEWSVGVVVLLIATTSIVGFYRLDRVVRAVREHPLLAAVDVLLAAGITTLVGADSPLIFYTLSTSLLIGVLLPRLSTVLLTLVLLSSQVLAIVESSGLSRSGVLQAMAVPVACVVIVLLGSVARVLHEQVLVEHDEVARLRADAAQKRERERIARDMHDSVAKSLHGIGIAAAALPDWLERDPEAGRERVVQLQQAAQLATVQAREMLSGLREHDVPGSLNTALRSEVARFSVRTDLPVRTDLADIERVSPLDAHQIARIVAEALENVARHAAATEVVVSSTADSEGRAVVEVTDDGSGFDVAAGTRASGHYGVRGMQERAAEMGGHLTVTSQQGHGTTVRVELPASTVREQTTGSE